MSSRPIATVLLRDEARAQALARLLDHEGVDTKVTTSTDQFYDLLNREGADLVLVEHRLRGFLTGLEILERLYDDLLRPPQMLIADLNPDEDQRAKRLGIDAVAETQTPLDELAQMAVNVVTHSRNAYLPVSAEARQLVQNADCIRPLPQLLVRMCSYLNEESASLESLARDIAVDPKATAELLKLANSSALGRAYRTTDVQSAVKYLGVRQTASLIISAGMLRAQSGLLAKLPESVRTWYNGRSVLIASTAAAFANSPETISPETAYILGLLQDIGCLVMAYAFPERYTQHLQRVRQVGHLRLECVEQNDFGFTHADVSAALLLKWDLPVSLATMVLDHHHPERLAGRSSLHQAFVRVMLIGEAAANLAENRSTHRYLSLHQQFLTYDREQLPLCQTALKDGINRTLESSRIFKVPVPDEQILLQLATKMQTFSNSPLKDAAAAQLLRPPRLTSERPRDAEPEAADAQAADVAGAHAAGPKAMGAAPLQQDEPPKILVVEDDPMVINVISLLLRRYGMLVQKAETISEARSMAPGCAAIVCDVHLADESSVELVQRLRREGFAGAIIMISGDRTRGTVEECIQAGIDDYLAKPFSSAALRAKLQQHSPELRARIDWAPAMDERLIGSSH